MIENKIIIPDPVDLTYYYPGLEPGSFYEQLREFKKANKDTMRGRALAKLFQVRALFWKEPFGTLMQLGKQETRKWHTWVRGWVLICTTKIPYTDEKLLEICGPEQLKRIEQLREDNIQFYMNGCAIAIGRIYGCAKMTERDENATFVKYNPELYVHKYAGVVPIVPFEIKGNQKWQLLDSKTIKKIIIA